MNVVVTGSLAFDYIMDFPGRFADRIMPDKIHKISLSFLVDKLSKQFGGTAGNIAYTLKLLSIEPLILSSAGNDFDSYKAHLRDHDISINYIKEHRKVSSGSYFGVTDQDDNQIGAFYEGPMKYNSNLSIAQIDQKVDLVVIGPHDPQAMVKHVKECNDLKLPYLYDPSFQIDHFSRQEILDAVRGSVILIGNDYEIALIEKKLGISHKKLLSLTQIVITTLGDKGSVIESSIDIHHNVPRPPLTVRGGEGELASTKIHIHPAKPQNTSDPTGAGDAYRAGFIAGYVRGFDLKTCGQMGSVAAVYTVEKYGTQTHMFTISEFKKRYKENFGSTINIS
jgi:adenosine kinase